MSLADRQKELASYLMAGFPDLGLPGLPLVSACASAGNATQENLCQPLTTGPKDHGSDGLFQWREERLTALQSWGDRKFGSWKSIKAQAAFHLYELKFGDAGGEKYDALYADLLAGKKSLATLTTNINRAYERSADNDEINQRRIKFANDVLTLMQGVPSNTPVVVATGASAGAAFLVAVWQFFASGGPQVQILFVIDVLLAGAVFYLGYLLLNQGAKMNLPNAVQSTPIQADPITLLKQATAARAAAEQVLESAKKAEADQAAVVSKYIADLQSQVNAIGASK